MWNHNLARFCSSKLTNLLNFQFLEIMNLLNSDFRLLAPVSSQKSSPNRNSNSARRESRSATLAISKFCAPASLSRCFQ
jgi:hypothetical protein